MLLLYNTMYVTPASFLCKNWIKELLKNKKELVIHSYKEQEHVKVKLVKYGIVTALVTKLNNRVKMFEDLGCSTTKNEYDVHTPWCSCTSHVKKLSYLKLPTRWHWRLFSNFIWLFSSFDKMLFINTAMCYVTDR